MRVGFPCAVILGGMILAAPAWADIAEPATATETAAPAAATAPTSDAPATAATASASWWTRRDLIDYGIVAGSLGGFYGIP